MKHESVIIKILFVINILFVIFSHNVQAKEKISDYMLDLDQLHVRVPFKAPGKKYFINQHMIDHIEFDNQNEDAITADTLPADITYLIADIKYDDRQHKKNPLKPKRLSIIEFGDGNFAGYKVIDRTVEMGLVWKKIWYHLHSFNLPIFYVGNPSPRNLVAWNTFKLIGGIHTKNLKSLQMNDVFLRESEKDLTGDLTSISDYKGIIVFKRYRPKKKELREFQEKFPQFLIINHASTKHAGDKKLTDELFDNYELKQYRPKAAVYPRVYTEDLAQQIIDDLQCKWFVIKPINSGRGNGILMVKKNQLDRTLKLILHHYNNNLPYDNDYSYRTNRPLTYSYWKYDRNSHFIVEEYVPSKPIKHNNKKYDATMRVIFTLIYDKGNINLNFVDAYWKRPIKPLSARGTFREKHISKHAPNYIESLGGEVSNEDAFSIYDMLAKVLPEIYTRILTAHYSNS